MFEGRCIGRVGLTLSDGLNLSQLVSVIKAKIGGILRITKPGYFLVLVLAAGTLTSCLKVEYMSIILYMYRMANYLTIGLLIICLHLYIDCLYT